MATDKHKAQVERCPGFVVLRFSTAARNYIRASRKVHATAEQALAAANRSRSDHLTFVDYAYAWTPQYRAQVSA